MKDYNTRLAELNKELIHISTPEERCKCGQCIGVRSKIEQLNELRAEAIEEVKELQYNIKLMEADTYNQEWTITTIKKQAVIDHLKAKWNIEDWELINSKEEAIARIKELNKRFDDTIIKPSATEKEVPKSQANSEEIGQEFDESKFVCGYPSEISEGKFNIEEGKYCFMAVPKIEGKCGACVITNVSTRRVDCALKQGHKGEHRGVLQW